MPAFAGYTYTYTNMGPSPAFLLSAAGLYTICGKMQNR